MHLPTTNEVTTPGGLHLLRCDRREWHSPNRLRATRYRYRINRLLALIRRYVPAGRVIEVGCAQANLSTLLAERGYSCLAIDVNIEFLRYARLKRTHGVVDYLCADGDNLPLKGEFDVVILTELLEHVAWPEDFLRSIRPLCKDLLVLSTPNGAHRWNTLPTFKAVQATDRSEFMARQFGPDGADHLFLYTMEELTSLVEAAGFAVCYREWYDYDLIRRVANRLRPMSLWRTPLRAMTWPLGWLATMGDQVMQQLPLAHRALAQGLIMLAHPHPSR